MKRGTTGGKHTTDGRRKRRHSESKAKRQWYARHRAVRFARHFGI